MNKLLLTGDKFMPELVLKQPGWFTLEIVETIVLRESK